MEKWNGERRRYVSKEMAKYAWFWGKVSVLDGIVLCFSSLWGPLPRGLIAIVLSLCLRQVDARKSVKRWRNALKDIVESVGVFHAIYGVGAQTALLPSEVEKWNLRHTIINSWCHGNVILGEYGGFISIGWYFGLRQGKHATVNENRCKALDFL